MKKLTSIALALTLLTGLLSISVFASELEVGTSTDFESMSKGNDVTVQFFTIGPTPVKAGEGWDAIGYRSGDEQQRVQSNDIDVIFNP